MAKFLKTSHGTLITLAASVWIIGGIILLRSGLELLQHARSLNPAGSWPWLSIGLGGVLGIFQALTLFSRSCRVNIQRIRHLKEPYLWQFFRPGFFLALAGMISVGVLLDHISRGRYFFTLFVAGIDFALTISLLGSSSVFWTDWFHRNARDG
jgi:hypothetical protein